MFKAQFAQKRAHLRSWNCISQCGTSTKNQPRMMPNFHIFWFFHTFLTGLTISILGQRSQMVVQRKWGTLNIELLVLCLSYTRLCSKILEHLNRTWRKEYVPLSGRSQDSRIITVIKKSDPKQFLSGWPQDYGVDVDLKVMTDLWCWTPIQAGR